MVSWIQKEKARTYEEINKYPITKLCPPLNETTLIQALVSQYLAHDGYVDTAKAFAHAVQSESRALESDSRIGSLDPKGDSHARNRQGSDRFLSPSPLFLSLSRLTRHVEIRRAILRGDVDRALELTNKDYPDVLKNNELLYFRLRRRKLVEMIREVAETVNSNSGYSKNSYNGSSFRDDFDHNMDIDDPLTVGPDWGGMAVEDVKDSEVKDALSAAVEYGQKLRVEFLSDSRPEIKKALHEAVSLLAYSDPKSSPVAHLLDEDGRIADGEELNSAILGNSRHPPCTCATDADENRWCSFLGQKFSGCTGTAGQAVEHPDSGYQRGWGAWGVCKSAQRLSSG